LWVRFYDVPWNKQTKEYGELIGSKLGKNDHLRVRIDWPLKQRLLARFKTNNKGQAAARVYPMQYKRVPYFCFYCGFIGHDKDQCERLVRGAPLLGYDATLRCSPKRKYEGRSIATSDEPAAKRNLFNTPAGSVNSSTLGKPRYNGCTSRSVDGYDIPPAVDAYDGFDAQERRTDDGV
jgi:hypothetical protein